MPGGSTSDDGLAPRTTRLLATAAGTHRHAFGTTEWTLLATSARLWGGSFRFLAIALEDVAPGVIPAGRVLFGGLALAAVPAARRRLPRHAWPRLAVLSVCWMAVPFACFAVAEQWISSSLAGMLNSAVPLAAALVASVLLRRLPAARQTAGLLIGFVGVLAMMWPTLDAGRRSSASGAGLVLLAVGCYGIATNVTVPLQQEYGALPVLLHAQAGALVLTLPFAVAAWPGSTLTASAVGSLLALGALGTGLAFVAAATLIGRAGATRGSVLVYFTPVVAIGAGVILRDEKVVTVALAGLALVLAGAWLTTRAEP